MDQEKYSSQTRLRRLLEGTVETQGTYVTLSLEIDDFDLPDTPLDRVHDYVLLMAENAMDEAMSGHFTFRSCEMQRAWVCLIDAALLSPADSSGYARLRDRAQIAVKHLGKLGISSHVLASNTVSPSEGWQQIVQLRDFRRLLDRDDGYMQYSAFAVPKSAAWLHSKELEYTVSFYQSMSKGDYGAAGSAFTALVDEMFFTFSPQPQNILNSYHTLTHILFTGIMELSKLGDSQLMELLTPEELFLGGQTVAEIKSNMLSVFEALASRECGQLRGSLPTNKYQAVFRYIENNFTDVSLNVTTVAHKFGITPAYLSRIYRQYSGQRLMDHVTTLRVLEAKKLILGGHGVENTANAVGFGSVTTMRRAFIKVEGKNPSMI